MLAMLLAYDAEGNVVATLDYAVARDETGNVTGLVDFAAHEMAGGKLRDIWDVSSAAGSGTWPEWLGGAAHDFTVELDKEKHIVALVHRTSGHRRKRADIEAAIEAEPVINSAKDIRHIVGGPDRPLWLDDKGQTMPRPANSGTPKHLPLIGRVQTAPTPLPSAREQTKM